MCHRPDIQSLQPEHSDTCNGVLPADGCANIARNHFNSMNANTNVGSGSFLKRIFISGSYRSAFLYFCIVLFSSCLLLPGSEMRPN
jgi:hypothetical protein